MKLIAIEATPREKQQLRVAAYCRVSTDSEEQESSIENQIAHYKELIESNPGYDFAGIYYDRGISGFKEDRPGFQKMMADARAGKVDLIITKSITRFARNTGTVLNATRELKGLGIGVFFELQNINTLTQNGELLMTVYAAFAQGESENYRDLARMRCRRQFAQGKPLYQMHKAFGYRAGREKGTFEIVPEEAEIVKQIYKWVRDEYQITTILKMAKERGFHFRDGSDLKFWHVYRMIRNVIYKGDYIMQRRYIDDNRRCLVNKGELPSWYIENDHPAIVSRKLWEQANAVINKREEEKQNPVSKLPMTDENYPYRKKLFCGYCGRRLGVGSNRSQYTFYCKKRNCCQGISVTQKVVESWGEITDNIYIFYDSDKPIPTQYSYIKESTWKKKYTRQSALKMKPYTKENYFYYKRVFCEKCGWPLYRRLSKGGKIVFICGGQSEHRSAFCEGITVPEEVLDRLPDKDGYFIIREEKKGGEKHYSYSCRKEKPERNEYHAGKED